MNIYIYGNQSFKKEIHETLDHSNIKFKLDSDSLIEDINSLDELKEIIKNNPKDIYLIDDEKIIKKNSLNKKIKFLTPKDGIEEEFLLDSGIADLSVDSLKEIPKYILRKYEEQKSIEPHIQESISDIVDDAYSQDKSDDIELDEELSQLLVKEEPKEENFDSNDSNVNLNELENLIGNNEDPKSEQNSDFNDNFGLNNISFDYDDEETLSEEKPLKDEDILAGLLDENIEDEEDSIEEVFEDTDFLEEIFGKKDENIKKSSTNEEFEELEEAEEREKTEEKLLESVENKVEKVKEIEPLKGENMSQDEFSELDLLSEQDLLEALNSVDNQTNNEKMDLKVQTNQVTKVDNSMDISSSNINDLSQLISKLLNNKTLEITIKIKD